MITFEITKDLDTIQRIVTHPKIYNPSKDDFAPEAEEWKPPMSEAVNYVLAKEDEEIIGIFVVVFESPIFCKIHLGFLPSAWGERAASAAKAFPQWLWQTSNCVRLVGEIPDWNELAIRMAGLMGMKKYGENPQSILKQRKLHSLVLMGMSRPESRVVCRCH